MNREARLALVKQDFERLLSMRDPATVHDWQPSESERATYRALLDSVLGGLDTLRSIGRRQLLNQGNVQSYVSDTILAFYREQLEPRYDALKSAYKRIDPDGAEFYELTEGFGAPRGANGRVKNTFEVAIEQVYGLIERNPDLEYESEFLPDAASEFMDSKLIGFDPDSWLDRAGELTPVRTSRKNVDLHVHARYRLEEIYRSYIFGNWLSVLALSRSLLEYVILENLVKFGIDPLWPTTNNPLKRTKKKLADLIDEIGRHLPHLQDPMHKLRDFGNDYLHPKISRISNELLFQRKQDAKQAIELLTHVIEDLYQAKAAKT